MYILGIETSCDETSCAVLKNYHVLSNVTVSSLKQHAKYGGVIPEIATRSHLKNIDKVLQIALKESGVSLRRVDLVAVTYKPGLMGALVVGLNFAKALAWALDKPFIGVNHLYAHLFAAFLNNPRLIKFPFLGLVVSGGHSDIYKVNDFNDIKLAGCSSDDACGEVYDKVARVLGLGYPGGPVIDRLFDEANKNDFDFKCGRRGLNLSFSGIKTAVIYKKTELRNKNVLNKKTIQSVVSSFQESVVNAITQAVRDAAKKYRIKKIVCGGGVIANRYLRSRLAGIDIPQKEILMPPLEYSTDNAAMVAGLGFYLYNKKGAKSDFKLEAQPN